MAKTTKELRPVGGKWPDLIVAVDPGDKHVGIATWHECEPELWTAHEINANQAVNHIKRLLNGCGCNIKILVVESFVLYPDKAGAQAYSPMLTSEMIGALKHVAKEIDTEVVEQGAFIKEPTRKQLKARGIKQLGVGTHARDAELHLIHYLLKNNIANFRKQPINQRKL